MQEFAKEQREEIERAIIDCGKYKLREQYQFMSVPQDRWCRMTQEARTIHLKKFHQMSISVLESISQVSLDHHAISSLSVNVEDAAANSTAPISVFQGIWSKATQLFNLKMLLHQHLVIQLRPEQ